MRDLSFIRHMTAGENYINRPVLVLEITERETRKGKPYVSLKVTDGDKTVQVNHFGYTMEDMTDMGIAAGEVAEISMYLKEPYYNVSEIIPCDDPEVSAKDFIRSVPDTRAMFDAIEVAIILSVKDCENTEVTTVALNLLRKNVELFKTSSAAKVMHHALLGGLVYHSYRMVKAAEALCCVYTDLDAEMLISAAALHDIGKIVELKTTITGEADYTIDGRLFGHTLIGIQMIEKTAEELGLKCERIKLLEHCIAAHHGKAEYGAITVPATAEAQALNILDSLDAKMYQFEDAYRSVDYGMLSGKIFALDNTTVYRPYDDLDLDRYFASSEQGEQNEETDGGGTLYDA